MQEAERIFVMENKQEALKFLRYDHKILPPGNEALQLLIMDLSNPEPNPTPFQ